MKTKDDIQKEITDLEKLGKSDIDKESLTYKRAQKKVLFYRNCLLYLNSEPTESFLTKEKERIENKLALIKSGFASWLKITNKAIYGDNPESFYNRTMEVAKLNSQLDMINFLMQ